MAQLYACSQCDLLRKKINICMTNSDNTYGTFNKRTEILTQIDDGSTAPTTFATVAEAKSYFYTDNALAVHDECCTELQWALVGTTGLKFTMTFGTKGGNIAPADDWAEQYNSRKTALRNSNNWVKNPCSFQETDSHLF
jgi:hypothetical protein